MGAPRTTRRYDVFLSHTRRDGEFVERLAEKLVRAQVDPWLDSWCLVPGEEWQDGIAEGLRASSSCAVVVGPSDVGAWSQEEAAVALDRAATDPDFRVFLVLLPGLPEPFDATALSPFLRMRTWVDFRAGLDDGRALQGLIAAIRGLPLGPAVPLDGDTGVCPYRGLEPFDEEHAEFFFGRDAEIQRVLEQVKGTRFVAVLGASGSGKSSLVMAGLLPQLRAGAVAGSETWRICVMRPGGRPLDALAARLVALLPDGSMQRTVEQLSSDPRTLHLAATLALADAPPAARVLLVVDQFEEVFTQCHDDEQREALIANLLYASSIPDGRAAVVMTMRADFYHRCLAHPELAQQVAAQQFAVSPVDRTGLRQAIEEPARLVGLSLEPGLVETILDDVAAQPGALPLLEHALLELWRRRAGSVLTLAGYQESAGVRGAIAARADVVFGGLTTAQQEIARHTLLRLTEPGEGTEDTRRRAALRELVTDERSVADVEEVVHRLAEARLLTLGTDGDSGEEWVDVAHEALIRGWPRLQRWVDEDRAGLRVHRRLTVAAEDWDEHGRDDGLLYRGPRLDEVLAWRERHRDAPNRLESGFIDAGVALRAREAAAADEQRRLELVHAQALAEARGRAARRFRLLSIVIAGAALALTALALFAWNAQRDAIDQRNRVVPTQLAAQSQATLAERPRLALLLAVEARRAMRDTGTQVDAVDSALRRAVQATGGTVLARHGSEVSAVAFDDDRVAIGERDGAVHLADTRTGRTISSPSTYSTVADLHFMPDGRLLVGWRDLATADEGDRAVRLLEPGAAGDELDASRVPGVRGRLAPAVVSENGRWLAGAAASGGVLRLWDLGTGQPVTLPGRPVRPGLHGPGDRPIGVAFTPDGRRLAAVSRDDGRLLVWDLPDDAGASPRLALTGHGTLLTDTYDVGPPSRLWALQDAGGGASDVLDLAAGRSAQPVRLPRVRPDELNTLTAAPRGDWIGGTAPFRVNFWRVRGGQGKPARMDPVGADGFRVSSSPNGIWLVVAGSNQEGRSSLMIWDTRGPRPRPIALPRVRTGVAAAPPQRWVALGDDSGAVERWDLGSAERGDPPSIVKRGPRADPVSMLVAADDRSLVTRTTATVLVQPLDRGPDTPPVALRGHDGVVEGAFLSPDGRRLVTAGEDRSARLWLLPYAPADGALDPDQQVALACRTAARDLTTEEWRTYRPGTPYRRTC